MTIPAEVERSEQVEDTRDVEEDASSFHSSILSAEDDEALQAQEDREHFNIQRAACRFLLFPCLVIFIIMILFFLFVFGALPMLIASIILISAYYCCTQDPIAPRVLFAALWNEENNMAGAAGVGGAPVNFSMLAFTEEDIHLALLRRKCLQVAKRGNGNEYQALLDNVCRTAAVSLSHDKTENHLSPEQVFLQTPDCILMFSTPLAVEEGIKNKKETWSDISDESLLRILRALERGGDLSHSEHDTDNEEHDHNAEPTHIPTEDVERVDPVEESIATFGSNQMISVETEAEHCGKTPIENEDSEHDSPKANSAVGSDAQESQEQDSSCKPDVERNDHVLDTSSCEHPPDKPGSQIDTSDLRERGTVCDICLIEYEEGDVLAWSKNKACDHAFHEDCIKGWLPRNPTCPSCRQNYIVKE